MKPVILIIENATDITGSLNSILRSSIYLRDDYHFLFILPKGSKAVPLISREGFEVHEFPMVEIRKSFNSLLMYVPLLFRNAVRLRKFVEQHQVDLILNNDFYNLLPAAYKLAGGKIRYLCYVRFLPSKFPLALVRLWNTTHLRFAHRIIAVSEAVKRELPTSGKIVVIGNELPLISQAMSPADSKIILYPSNFIQGKGHEFAVRAIAALPVAFRDWKVRFIGSDMGLKKNAHFKQSLMRLASTLGVVDQTEWLQYDDNIIGHYNQASIVLNFSESESFSMTCLEAMFYGRPVVATRCGGPEEIINDQKNGYLVPIGDVAQMTEAILKLVSDKELRQRMGSSAYQHVREKFSAANTIEKLRELYQLSLLR